MANALPKVTPLALKRQAAALTHDLEGIVAKRKADPYRRGVHWWKIKNRAYSQADDGRRELLNGTLLRMMRQSRAALSPVLAGTSAICAAAASSCSWARGTSRLPQRKATPGGGSAVNFGLPSCQNGQPLHISRIAGIDPLGAGG